MINRANGVLALVLQLSAISFASAGGILVNDYGEGFDADLNDGVCDIVAGGPLTCTLRAAIEQANFNPGQDIIEFQDAGTVMLAGTILDITDDLVLRRGQAPEVTITSTTGFGSLLRILNNGTVVSVEDLTFAHPRGAAISTGAGPNVTIQRCLFDGNGREIPVGTASRSGGALRLNTTTTILNSEFRNNVAELGGAVSMGTDSFVEIINTTFESNTGGNGGAIGVFGSHLRLVDTEIRENLATQNGGGVYTIDGGLLETEGVRIYDNTAGGDGGGIWVRNIGGGSDRDALQLVGADVRGNVASGLGGGIYLGSGVGLHDFHVSRSTVWENEASEGGGIYILGSQDTVYTLVNTTISGNLSAGDVGGLFAFGDTTILHSTIWDNSGTQLFDANNGFASVSLGNSMVGTVSSASPVCSINLGPAPPIQLGPNLASDATCAASIVGDPELQPPQNAGGQVPIMPFPETSLAVDSADFTLCAADPVNLFDAIGPNRPRALGCDLGAWEGPGLIVFRSGFEESIPGR